MKNSSKKHVVILLTIASISTKVTLCFEVGRGFYVKVRDLDDSCHKFNTSVLYFDDKCSAENYIFDNYGYLIIPYDRFKTEGIHLFVY